MVWLVLKTPESRTLGGLRFIIWQLMVKVLYEVNHTNVAEPAWLSGFTLVSHPQEQWLESPVCGGLLSRV